MRKTIFGIGLVAAFTVFMLLFARNASAPSTEQQGKKSNQSAADSSFDKSTHPLDQPDSIWWIVSKVRPVSPISFAPSDLVVPKVPLRAGSGDSEMRLRKEAAEALENLVSDAKAGGYQLMLASGYRSYQRQVSVYNGYVQQYGQAGADKFSARPGTSEHQTGMAADLEPTSRQCELEQCFGNLPEGIWVAANAYKYGFVVRYLEGKSAITGYDFEPWHIRYVGKDLSTEMRKQNIQTLEEFFNIVPEKQPY